MTDTKLLGGVIVNGVEHDVYVALTDGTAAEITVRDKTGALKNLADLFPDQNLEGFWLTVGTPSDLDLVQLLDEGGGIICEWIGCVNAALGHVPQLSVPYGTISMPVRKGYAFEATTSD